MDGVSDAKSVHDSVTTSLVQVTRSAAQISSSDLDFYRSLDPAIGTALDTQNARLLALTERLLGNAASDTEVVRPRLVDLDSLDSGFRGVVDVIDSLLEKADISLDEYTGTVKRFDGSQQQVSFCLDHGGTPAD